MLRKTVALAALAAAFVVAPATSAVAEPYTPPIPTEASIEVTTNGPGKAITIVVSASADSPTPPEGDLAVEISASASAARGARALIAAPLYTTTVHFVDEPISIVGPRLPKGTYIGAVHFTPDDASFLSSDDTDGFRIAAGGGDVGGVDDGNNGSGLPNTGGPNVMWLILGTGLVAAGAGGVGYGRRRQGNAA